MRILCSLYLCFLFIRIGWSQEFKFIQSEYIIERINLNIKEDIGKLNGIMEDNFGYIWISSEHGLSAFDGNGIITYANNEEKYKLTSSKNILPTYKLLQKGKHILGFDEGHSSFHFFDVKKRKVVSSILPGDIDGDKIAFSSNDTAGNIYLCTSDYLKNSIGIWRNSGNKFEKIYSMEIDLSSTPYMFYVSAKYHWIVTETQIVRVDMDGKNEKVFSVRLNLRYIMEDAAGRDFYYFDLKTNTINKWDEAIGDFSPYFKMPLSFIGKGEYFYFLEDKFFFGDNLSLFVVDIQNRTIQDLSKEFIDVVKKESPGSLGALFVKFFQRRDKAMLMCNQRDVYLLKKKFSNQFLESVVPVNKTSQLLSFRALAEDKEKNVYASYYTGLSKKSISSSGFVPIKLPPSLVSNAISTYSLNIWNDHLLWNNIDLNLSNGKYEFVGLNKFGKHCTQYLHQDTLWLFPWFNNQLHVYDLKRKKIATHELDRTILNKDGQNISEMNDMTGDPSRQSLWISTTDQGLIEMTKQGKLLQKFTSRELGLVDNNVTDLEIIGDELWFGCKEGLGVLHLKTKKTNIYKNPITGSNGLVSNRKIFSIIYDNEGRLYLGTDHGLVRYDLATKTFYNLEKDHPLSKPEFNRGSAFRSSEGRFYMGSTDGLYSFKPEEVEFSRDVDSLPNIKLVGLSTYDYRKNSRHHDCAGLDSIASLTLNPYENYLEVNLSLPEFNNAVYYSYRLKGQSDIWSEYDTKSTIELNGLPTGSFVLEIKASTGLKEEASSFYALPINKSEIWYKKAWVVFLMAIGGAAIGIAYYRNSFSRKIKQHQELEMLRNKISADLHDDVGSILTGLSMQSEILALHADDEQKKSLTEISAMSREAMDTMRDTVWFIDSRKDKFENLIDRMRSFAEQQFQLKNVAYKFEQSNVIGEEQILPHIRQNVYFIFKEAITNVIKHSDANEVRIGFFRENGRNKLIIQDNGHQISRIKSDGQGLSNMKQRALSINGNLEIDTSDGFEIRLTF